MAMMSNVHEIETVYNVVQDPHHVAVNYRLSTMVNLIDSIND